MAGNVSIIVPCYNQAEYLGETLNSVIKQSYPNWECIIVNDGSSDNSEQIALEYCKKDNRFKYLFQSNQGPSTARNNGIAQTSGEFILPLDGDDIIGETYIEKCVKHFQSHPQTKLVYCKAQFLGTMQGLWNLPEYNYKDFIWRNCIFNSAMFRRVDYNKTQGYNPNMCFGLEDWDFWLSLLQEHDCVYRIPEAIFFYRRKDDSRDSTAHLHLSEMQEQIVLNHPKIYEEFGKELIVFQHKIDSLHEEINDLKETLLRVSSSKPSRILSLFKKHFTG